MEDKSTKLFYILGSFFIANALLAEFIGVKIFSLEKTLGFDPMNLSLLGIDNLSFNLTAGTLLWPIVFIMTDIINEYYGKRGVRFLSLTAAALILYSFLMIFAAVALVPAEFWVIRDTPGGKVNMDISYNVIFGQGMWIILGSLSAFLIGQIIDVFVFHIIKVKTGAKKIWLRSTGSTLVSQFIDSFVVLFIAFYLGANWNLTTVIAIGIVNYIYKFLIAVILTPILYVIHFIVDRYLGKEMAHKLILSAINK
ncbi:MAG TPA: queuosine precursor transporter [Ignavibacteriaceae bacterium]|nr:queuosine precursor transporter [Ignavibacteriaceae bacterium]